MVDNYGTPRVKSWLWRPFQQEQSGSKFRFFPSAILLGLLVGIASYWSSNKEILGLFHDDAIYAVVAKSLSDGARYRIISLPTAPDQTKYPFLYSFILSWLWSLDAKFPDNIGLLKAANAGFLAAIFVFSYLFYRRRVTGEESESLLFAALVCINPAVFSFTDFTVSDILLLLLSLSALVIVDVSVHSRPRLGSVTLLAVIVALACLTRSAAVPLAPDFTVSDILFLLLSLSAVVIFDASEQCTSRHSVTLLAVIVALGCLTRSLRTLAVAGAIHFAWSKRYRDLTHTMSSGSVYYPLGAVGQNPFKPDGQLAASVLWFLQFGTPGLCNHVVRSFRCLRDYLGKPALYSCGSGPDIPIENNPRPVVTCRLSVAIGSMAVV